MTKVEAGQKPPFCPIDPPLVIVAGSVEVRQQGATLTVLGSSHLLDFTLGLDYEALTSCQLVPAINLAAAQRATLKRLYYWLALQRQPAPKRVYHTLILLADPDGIVVIKQADLGRLCSITRIWCNKILANLEQDGMIRRRGRAIHVLQVVQHDIAHDLR